MNRSISPLLNPLLSLPLIGGKAVEGSEHPVDQAEILHLTRQLAAGDERAFGEFHERYFGRLYQFLLVVVRGQEQQAKDALQETMLRVARYARPFESQEVFWCWLKVLARSAARDAGRKQQRYGRLLERFALRVRLHYSQPSDREESLLLAALEESLAELPQGDCDLLKARYVIGNTIKELCLETGTTEKSMESRLGRLRKDLHQRVLRKLRSL